MEARAHMSCNRRNGYYERGMLSSWGWIQGIRVPRGRVSSVAEVAASLSIGTMAFFVAYYLLGFLFYATLFAGIGAVCNTDQEAQQLQQPIVLCLVFTIMVPMMIIQNPDSMFATVISLIPFFTPIVMFMRINILTPPVWQIVLSFLIMIGSIYAAALLSAKIFRIGILMYGKRPDLREMIKWMRRA